MSLSLICLLASTVVVFGFRVALQYLTTRDSGLRISHSKSSKTEMRVVYTQGFAILGMLLMTVLESLGVINAHLELGFSGTVVGITLLIVGWIVVVSAQLQMGRAWRIGVDESETTELITHGLFKYSRNPIYAGMLVLAFAMLVLLPHVAMCLFEALGYGGVETQVRLVEEPHLRKVHGSTYDNYCLQVNRYVPTPKVT